MTSARWWNLQDAAYFLRILNPGNEVVVTHRNRAVCSLCSVRSMISDALQNCQALQTISAVEMVKHPVETRAVGAHGVIERSLFAAAQDAGIADPRHYEDGRDIPVGYRLPEGCACR